MAIKRERGSTGRFTSAKNKPERTEDKEKENDDMKSFTTKLIKQVKLTVFE